VHFISPKNNYFLLLHAIKWTFNSLQALCRNMGIYFCCLAAFVSPQFLYVTLFGTTFQLMHSMREVQPALQIAKPEVGRLYCTPSAAPNPLAGVPLARFNTFLAKVWAFLGKV